MKYVLEKEKDGENQLDAADFLPQVDFQLPDHIRDIDKGGVPESVLGKNGAVFIVKLVQF